MGMWVSISWYANSSLSVVWITPSRHSIRPARDRQSVPGVARTASPASGWEEEKGKEKEKGKRKEKRVNVERVPQTSIFDPVE